MDAFDAAVVEAAGWLPRVRAARTSLTVPVPETTSKSYRTGGRKYQVNATKSAWPDVCVRCGTPTGWPTCGWPLGAECLYGNGCAIGVSATLPATRRWICSLARLIPEATIVEEVSNSDGRAENAQIRAAKPWRRLSQLSYACAQCAQTASRAQNWRLILATARRDGSVRLYGRTLSLADAEREYGFAERPPYNRDSA